MDFQRAWLTICEIKICELNVAHIWQLQVGPITHFDNFYCVHTVIISVTKQAKRL